MCQAASSWDVSPADPSARTGDALEPYPVSVCLSSCLSHLAAAIAAAAGARRLAAPHSWVPVAAAAATAAPHTQSVSCTTAVGRGGLLVRKQKDVALPGLREGCETQAPRSACRSQCDMEL